MTPAPMNFMEERSRHVTELVRRAPAPQEWEPWSSDEGREVVTYMSAGRELRGYLQRGPGTGENPGPALLYLHGGFALGVQDVLDVSIFASAGVTVFAPALRGENGNPGDFEFFYGEVDDARAALEWLVAQPGVDPERVFVFGHSAGGVIASLLALQPDLPAALTGSAGGLYDERVFGITELPFADNRTERSLRLMLPHAEQLAQRHMACIGANDLPVMDSAAAIMGEDTEPNEMLEFVVVLGDHMSSLPMCVLQFSQRALPGYAIPAPRGAYAADVRLLCSAPTDCPACVRPRDLEEVARRLVAEYEGRLSTGDALTTLRALPGADDESKAVILRHAVTDTRVQDCALLDEFTRRLGTRP